MTTNLVSTNDVDVEPKASWLPMVVIGMGQVQMSLNTNALPVSIGTWIGWRYASGIIIPFTIVPARRLPRYVPGEVSSEPLAEAQRVRAER